MELLINERAMPLCGRVQLARDMTLDLHEGKPDEIWQTRLTETGEMTQTGARVAATLPCVEKEEWFWQPTATLRAYALLNEQWASAAATWTTRETPPK